MTSHDDQLATTHFSRARDELSCQAARSCCAQPPIHPTSSSPPLPSPLSIPLIFYLLHATTYAAYPTSSLALRRASNLNPSSTSSFFTRTPRPLPLPLTPDPPVRDIPILAVVIFPVPCQRRPNVQILRTPLPTSATSDKLDFPKPWTEVPDIPTSKVPVELSRIFLFLDDSLLLPRS